MQANLLLPSLLLNLPLQSRSISQACCTSWGPAPNRGIQAVVASLTTASRASSTWTTWNRRLPPQVQQLLPPRQGHPSHRRSQFQAVKPLRGPAPQSSSLQEVHPQLVTPPLLLCRLAPRLCREVRKPPANSFALFLLHALFYFLY